MKLRSRIILILITLIVGIPYILYNYITLHNVNRFIVDTVVMVVVSIIVWCIGKQYDRAAFYQKELEKKKIQLTRSYQEMQEIFNNVDAMLLSNDLINEKIVVSKGIEKLLGYKAEEFSKNYYLWMEAIYPDDKKGVNIFCQKLLSGQASIHEWRVIGSAGQIKWIQSRGNPIIDKSGKLVKLIIVVFDINKQKKAEEKIEYMAYHDNLTGLPNRFYLFDYLSKSLARSKRKEQTLSVMFMDLDELKGVNDKFGHEVGDLLLKQVAERLRKSVRENDIVSRLGGDEFIIVLEDSDKEGAIKTADRIIEEIYKPYYLNGHEALVTISIGISLYPDDGDKVETLIKKADKAMYSVKKQGKNNFQLYTSELGS